MGLASWFFNTYSGAASSVQSIDALSNPFSQAGSGCLRISFPANAAQPALTAIYASAPGPAGGFSAGRLRSLFWIENSFTVATFSNLFGIFFMADRKADTGGGITSNAASCYTWEYNSDDKTLRFLRLSRGLSGYANARVITTHAFSANQYSVVALQVDWFTDSVSIGGTYMKGYVGSSWDYSDIACVVAIIDTLSFLSATSGEGVWGGTRTNNASAYTLKIDEGYLWTSA